MVTDFFVFRVMKSKKIITIVFAIFAFCFWAFYRPEWLSFHEQYQLFLFSFDYLFEHLALPGGFAVWTAEFFVQFFYHTFLGAIVISLILTSIYLLLKNNENHVIALLPSVLIWMYAGDECMLMTFPVAIIFALGASKLYQKISYKNKLYLQILFIPLLYWLTGYCTYIYIILAGLESFGDEVENKYLKRISVTLGLLLYLVLFQFFTAYFITRNYPFIDIFCGINYYRNRMEIPIWQHIIAISCVVVNFLKIKDTKPLFYVQLVSLLAALFLGVNKKYEESHYTCLKTDYFVRYQKWDEMINYASKLPVQSDFTLTGLNLALAMTDQMPSRVFEFPQSGNNGLISEFDYTCFSCSPTAEVCYYLGLSNSVLRYNFDMQSAIVNCNNSGRFTKRIAESYILNRRYDVAQRYLNLLKHTLFYRSWALEAESCLYNEQKVLQNPEWARINKLRVKDGLNFSNKQLAPMLLGLFENCHENRMALNYALVSLLISKDLTSFVRVFPVYTANFGTANVPEIYQQAFLIIFLQSGYSLEKLPSFISPELVKQFDDFYNMVMLDPNNKAFKTGKFSKTYWKYYFAN